MSFFVLVSCVSHDGSGPCLPCPNQYIRGTLALGDARTQWVLRPEGGASVCEGFKECAGADPLPEPLRYRYHPYGFQNGASNICVQVELVTPSPGVYSAVYTNEFVPAEPCINHRADAGRWGTGSYAFPVGARERLIVVVAGPPESSYELRVSGGSCVPWLNIAQAEEDKVALSWPSFAADFHLHGTNALLEVIHCVPLPAQPLTIGGECVVTNTVIPPWRYYQLHRRLARD